jgi:hypothetical protein
MVVVLIDEGIIASLKVIAIALLIVIFVADAEGIVETTVGGVISAVDPVVKFQV